MDYKEEYVQTRIQDQKEDRAKLEPCGKEGAQPFVTVQLQTRELRLGQYFSCNGHKGAGEGQQCLGLKWRVSGCGEVVMMVIGIIFLYIV